MRKHGERTFLDVEEAIELLPEQCHTFKRAGAMLIGADCTRERAIEILNSASTIEISGPGTIAMGHGLTLFWHDDGQVIDGMAMATDADALAVMQEREALLVEVG